MKRYSSQKHKPFTTRRLEKKSRQSLIISVIVLVLFIYLFLNWILPALIGGLSVLNKFKHSNKVDTPISESEALAPPVLNIPFESTNSAQITIKGYAQENAKVEIYIDDELKKTVDTNGSGEFVAQDIDLSLGLNTIYGKTVDDKESTKSLPSKTIRIIYDNKKPTLEVTSPSDNQVFKGDKKVTISGKTDPGVTIQINSSRAIVDADGNFSTTLEIGDGETILNITATDVAGNISSLERRVKFEP